MRRRRSTDAVFLKALAGLAAAGALAAIGTAAMMTLGTLARNPARVLAAAVACVALVVAFVRLLQEARRRTDPDLLDPASELTTLTFPPTSRMGEGMARQRGMQQAKAAKG